MEFDFSELQTINGEQILNQEFDIQWRTGTIEPYKLTLKDFDWITGDEEVSTGVLALVEAEGRFLERRSEERQKPKDLYKVYVVARVTYNRYGAFLFRSAFTSQPINHFYRFAYIKNRSNL